MKLNVVGKLLLILLAILAVRMAGRALKHNAEVTAALWLLLGMTAAVSTAGTAKSRSTEDRLNSLIPSVFPNTGGTVNGSMTVTGNHQVGGQLLGPTGSGSTLTVGSPTHFSGVAMTVDNGLTSHGGVSADGNVTAGGNMGVSGNHAVGGSLTGGGGSGSTLTVASPTHFSGVGLTTDSTITSHGGVSADGNIHAGGTVSASNFSGSYAGGQGAVSPVTGGTPSTYTTAWASQVGSAVNGIINRLNSSGLC